MLLSVLFFICFDDNDDVDEENKDDKCFFSPHVKTK